MRGQWRVRCSVLCTTIWILRVRLPRRNRPAARCARANSAQRGEVRVEDPQLAPGLREQPVHRGLEFGLAVEALVLGFRRFFVLFLHQRADPGSMPVRTISERRRAQACDRAPGAGRRVRPACAAGWRAASKDSPLMKKRCAQIEHLGLGIECYGLAVDARPNSASKAMKTTFGFGVLR